MCQVKDEALKDIISTAETALETVTPPTDCGDSITLLPTPYVSQMGAGADKYGNDCGPASGLMVVKSYNSGLEMTVDAFWELGNVPGDQYWGAGDVMGVMSILGVPTTWHGQGLSIAGLYQLLVERKPPVCLIDYSTFRGCFETENKTFNGPHFLVVVGMDTERVFVHDPLWKKKGGEALPVPVRCFEDMWRTSGPENPGSAFAAIVPQYGLGESMDTYKMQVVYQSGLNVRSAPKVVNNPSNKVGGKPYGTIVTVYETVTDSTYEWARIGTDQWMAVRVLSTGVEYAIKV